MGTQNQKEHGAISAIPLPQDTTCLPGRIPVHNQEETSLLAGPVTGTKGEGLGLVSFQTSLSTSHSAASALFHPLWSRPPSPRSILLISFPVHLPFPRRWCEDRAFSCGSLPFYPPKYLLGLSHLTATHLIQSFASLKPLLLP